MIVEAWGCSSDAFGLSHWLAMVGQKHQMASGGVETGRFNVNNRRHPFHFRHQHQHHPTLFLDHNDEYLSPESARWLLRPFTWVTRLKLAARKEPTPWNLKLTPPYQHHWWCSRAEFKRALKYIITLALQTLMSCNCKTEYKNWGSQLKSSWWIVHPLLILPPLPPQFQPLFCTNRTARTPSH